MQQKISLKGLKFSLGVICKLRHAIGWGGSGVVDLLWHSIQLKNIFHTKSTTGEERDQRVDF